MSNVVRTLAMLMACMAAVAFGGVAKAAGTGVRDLVLAIEPRWRTERLDLPTAVVANDAKQPLRITRMAALISGVSLWRADGSVVRLEGQYGFIDVAGNRNGAVLHGVPEGEFVGLEFRIGVPENVNHADPGQWAAGHALNPLVNGLHWSWQGGYVFLALEGRWTDGVATEIDRGRGFSFHLAREPQLMTVRFAANFAVRGDTTVTLAFDLARVLAGRRFSTDDGSDSTHSANGDALAGELARGVERAWFWLDANSRSTDSASVPSHRSGHEGAEQQTTSYAFTVPAGFAQPDLPADNALTVEGVALGEALFHDTRLSRGGAQSCASCHSPEHAFSDTVALSRGVDGVVGIRNAMPLFNLAWSGSYAWDGSKPRIRDQARAAWTSAIEMHAEPESVVAVLATDVALRPKFAAAFGTASVTAERITLALEQFLLVQVAADSKFDRALRGEAELTAEEKRGFELFATEFDPVRGRNGADCFHCHGGALFTDYALKNNGLAAGAGDSTGGKFKTPSLRNVALTGPYMHDGRFATLEDVIAHYDHGVQRSAALDPNLAKHPNAGLQLSTDDQRALVAFLRALTDLRLDHSSPSQ